MAVDQAAAPAITSMMPALARGTHAHVHTVHSALESLRALGVPASRLSVVRAGRRGERDGTVVRQSPAPGTPLSGSTLIQLEVAGLGFQHALPVGMWDSGGDASIGTREIVEVFDDPLEKLAHWFHEGAPLFHLSPDDLPACERWLALFGIDAGEWPRTLWYRLSSIASSLSVLACSESGLAFVLRALLDLPVEGFRYLPTQTLLDAGILSRLRERHTALGIDLVVGDRVEALALLEVRLGPVELRTYEYFMETSDGRELMTSVLRLAMPASTEYRLRWIVGDRGRAPQLGHAAANARLGINTHMGGAPEQIAYHQWEPAGRHE